MKIIRQISKPAATFLAFYLMMLSVPCQSAVAAIIGTETLLNIMQGNEARVYVNSILAREDVQAALIVQGIDPKEAKTRIDSLSDAEVIDIADKIDQLPAGGFFETLLVVIFIVFLVLLVTDITGHTDVFPFVKKDASKKIDRNETAIDTSKKEEIKASLKNVEVKPDEILIINFNHDSNELSENAIEKLDRIFEIMLNNPDSELTINGFPGLEGSASYNKMLSESRVYTVKMYLVGKGLNPNRTKAGLYSTQANPPINSVEIKINFPPEGQ